MKVCAQHVPVILQGVAVRKFAEMLVAAVTGRVANATAPEPERTKKVRQAGAKSYPVGLVGESRYQKNIRGLRAGDFAELVHEPDNPHDARAISARDCDGATLGYLPRGHWLARVIIDEAKQTRVRIKDVTGGGRGESLGVVLTVSLPAAE